MHQNVGNNSMEPIAVPYDFQPRFPIDHALALVRLIRSGETGSGKALLLAGAIAGEIGALLGNGHIFTSEVTAAASAVFSTEELLQRVESLAGDPAILDANFDPTPWIPIILAILELILRRRG